PVGSSPSPGRPPPCSYWVPCASESRCRSFLVVGSLARESPPDGDASGQNDCKPRPNGAKRPPFTSGAAPGPGARRTNIALSPLDKFRAAGKFFDCTINKRPLTVSIEVT